MDKVLAFLCAAVGFGVIILAFPDGVGAVLVATVLAFSISLIINTFTDDVQYLQKLFIIGLLLRTTLAFSINYFDLQMYFGGDVFTYDYLGNRIVELWFGTADMNDVWSVRATDTSVPGWGMNYIVAFLYVLVGRNILAGSYFCSVIGAATAPFVYLVSHRLYGNLRVARTAALIVAVFPAFVIWSGQMLKDGLIVFLLVLTILMVLKLQEKFDYRSILILIVAMFGILSLRFYIFYMVAVAVTGSFFVGLNNSFVSMIRRIIVIIFLGLSLISIGVFQKTTEDFENYATLERINQGRMDGAKSNSGFGKDLDVSTTEGIAVALPVGFLYLMLAPFPWETTNIRQVLTLPEIFVWWAMIPFLISGLWFTIKTRLRSSIAILLFTLLLTFTYSIFQGNVGTAYRQRTQIQVFLVIFISVGITLYLEKQENIKLVSQVKRRRIIERLKVS